MILLKYHLRRHIAGCPWSFVRVLPLVGFCNSKISDFDVAFAAKNKIFRFDISMNDIVLVDVLQSNDHACNYEFTLVLVKLNPFPQVVTEVASRH